MCVSWRQHIAESRFLIHLHHLCPCIGKSRSFTCLVIAERRLLIPVFCWFPRWLILVVLYYLFYYYWGLSGLLSWTWWFPSYSCFHEIYFSALLLLRLSSLYGTPLSIAYSADLVVMNCLSLCLKCLLLYQFWKTVFLEITLFVSWLFSGLAMCHSTLYWHLGLLSRWSRYSDLPAL